MKVPFYNSAIFSGNLIHGPNHNYSKNIRVSLDFKIIKKRIIEPIKQNISHLLEVISKSFNSLRFQSKHLQFSHLYGNHFLY